MIQHLISWHLRLPTCPLPWSSVFLLTSQSVCLPPCRHAPLSFCLIVVLSLCRSVSNVSFFFYVSSSHFVVLSFCIVLLCLAHNSCRLISSCISAFSCLSLSMHLSLYLLLYISFHVSVSIYTFLYFSRSLYLSLCLWSSDSVWQLCSYRFIAWGAAAATGRMEAGCRDAGGRDAGPLSKAMNWTRRRDLIQLCSAGEWRTLEAICNKLSWPYRLQPHYLPIHLFRL